MKKLQNGVLKVLSLLIILAIIWLFYFTFFPFVKNVIEPSVSDGINKTLKIHGMDWVNVDVIAQDVFLTGTLPPDEKNAKEHALSTALTSKCDTWYGRVNCTNRVFANFTSSENAQKTEKVVEEEKPINPSITSSITSSIYPSITPSVSTDLTESKPSADPADLPLSDFAAGKCSESAIKELNALIINFSFGGIDLAEEDKQKISSIAKYLNNCPQKINLEGHSDSVGRASTNLQISSKRAQTVKQILVEAGIPDKQIHTKGLGSTRSIAPNTFEEGRQRNRRVEIRVDINN